MDVDCDTKDADHKIVVYPNAPFDLAVTTTNATVIVDCTNVISALLYHSCRL